MGGLMRESWPGTKEVLWKTHSRAIYAAKFATVNSTEVKNWEGLKNVQRFTVGEIHVVGNLTIKKGIRTQGYLVCKREVSRVL